jgi:endonuclease G
MNAERKLAFYTAVNIDGSISYRLKRETDRWIPDPRIDGEAQTGEGLYAGNDFDRGHLVRRLDPAWGDSRDVAKVANDDTFHFTNCSPQHKDFNQGKNLWAGLEDYILNNADNLDFKVTVFTGPVFRGNDDVYRDVRIPKEYWKVVTMKRSNGNLSATAYLVSQASLAADIREADFQFGAFKTFQVPVARIEQLTGLNFGRLRTFDPLAAGPTEATATSARPISEYEQITL